jgi:nucleotide-binding universal stress UspA family protein
MHTSSTSSGPAETTAPIFERIICGIDASRADQETVRQAAILAGRSGTLDLVCVAHHGRYGATEEATLGTERAETALVRAQQTAAKLGVDAATRIVEDRDRWQGLAQAASGHDLLVVGRHPRSRAEGILGGSVATEALHRAEIPVLLAAPTESAFPQRILLATDGSEDARAAADLTALISARFSSQVFVLTVGSDADRVNRHELARESAAIFLAAGVKPVIEVLDGGPRTVIVEFARQVEPSLVVLGSRGKHGVRALGSVSEHVAHHVSCSVLVARPAR